MKSEAQALLTLEQAGFAYSGGQPVLHGIELRIAAGEFHCLLGRSGCGKTSLLKLAAGLLLPSGGSVRWRGEPVRGPLREVAFVFQRPTLLEWLSVLDNVLLPVSLVRRTPHQFSNLIYVSFNNVKESILFAHQILNV